MISKIEEKQKAVGLRERGLSYSEILNKIPVAKSTLSLWLRSVGLSKRQRQRLTEKKTVAMRRGWLKVKELRLERTESIKKFAQKESISLIKNPFWVAGTMLYWAEGRKQKENNISQGVVFSNSDSNMILFFRDWLFKFCDIKDEDLFYELFIHKSADLNKALKFWSEKINIQPERIRTYLKRHSIKTKRHNTGNDYNGQIRVCVYKSTDLNRRISSWIEGIYRYCRVV